MAKKTASPTKQAIYYPPVIAVVGHVDHGKTTLLDTIRKTTIAKKEHGGITQNIGASSVEIVHDGKKRRITFIDTPGHEAFGKMRSRGTQAADIGILVVSSIDGVKPQTQESIQLLQEAKIPYIVALTMADMPTKNPERAKQQLIRENVLLEGYGGDIPFLEVSSKEGTNIKELLDLILLVKDVHLGVNEATRSPTQPFMAIVIESKLDPKIGPKATIVVKNGTLFPKDEVVCDDINGKVRALIDDLGKQNPSITVGEASEILGFSKVPPVGSIVYKKADLALGKVQQALAKPKEAAITEIERALSFDPFAQEDQPALAVLLCTDTLGSLEAILNALPTDEIRIVSKKTGEISEADVLMGKSIGAIVLSFNTRIRPEVASLASQERVLLKNYTIIYELIDEVKDVLEGKQLALEEVILGKAKILASFPYEKTKALGITVLEGRIAKGDRIRLMRNDEVKGECTISSVRVGKNPISKVEKGQEAGIIIAPLLDFTIGDVVLSHR